MPDARYSEAEGAACDEQQHQHRHGGHREEIPCPCSLSGCDAFHAGVAWAREHPDDGPVTPS
jgi:hypothetical protein